ncbi:restriction endonuclease subunit S [Bacteroides fragilis]|uniref:restriction endonuclease subunit S n=1 Tax=Bacteroides uniformis TaxID=820 RepID=UPI002A351633|nr:restriction endonuclease subunit S [Bacteroides fragilis]
MSSYYEKFIATGEVKCIDEEIPFEIPNGWEWERVGNIFFVTKLAGFEYTKFFTKEAISAFNPIPIVRAQNVRRGFFEENKNEAISEMLSNQLKRSALNKKCLLMTFIGAGIGDTCIFPAERKNHLAPNVAKIEPLDDSIFLDYAVFALMSPCGQRGVNAIKKSTAQPSLSMETIRKLLIPIPPFKEQKCISLKLSEVLPLVEKYSKVQKVQNQINDEINILLSKSILQEAIRGKLVPQIAEEGTADKLLAEIHKEKERLVKEGKLKKAILTDSVIYKGDDNKYYERINAQTVEIELPFEYPNSWAVLRLKDICQLIDGEKRNGKGICLDAKYLRGKSSATIIEKGKYVYTDDNIILVDGENSGEVFTVPQDGYMGSTFKQLWLSSTMWKPYILAFILFYKEELRNSKRGAAIPHLNKELFYNLPIGIPPYQEQQRIAERINELSQLLK